MKIQSFNPANLNAYKQQITKAPKEKQVEQSADQLKISDAAKQMQELQGARQENTERTEYVNEIKQSIQSGTYEINLGSTADKMIDFWSRRS